MSAEHDRVMLPDVIPIFPLPNVVLFPRMPLPLHIFEPRYRAMVRDAARGSHLIGMALLRGAGPAIFATGTVGEMVRVDELPDGRFDIVLRGLREYTIERELGRAEYRQGVVHWRAETPEPLSDAVRGAITRGVRRYIARLGRAEEPEVLLRDNVDDETFVNFFAQHLDVAPLEKQALLEAATLDERARRLVDVIEFRLEELRTHPPGPPGRAH